MAECPICGDPVTTFEHDHKSDLSGLDDGPDLQPRKKPPPKTPDELRDIRARAWATRRAKYGEYGHR